MWGTTVWQHVGHNQTLAISVLQPGMPCTVWSPRYKKMSSGNSIALSALSSGRFYNPHQTVASPAPLLFVPHVATSQILCSRARKIQSVPLASIQLSLDKEKGKDSEQSWGCELRTQITLFWGAITEHRSERPGTNKARPEQSEEEEHQGQAKRWKLLCRAQLQVLTLNSALAPLLSTGMTSTKCTCDTRARLYDHKPLKIVFFQVGFTPAECFNTK